MAIIKIRPDIRFKGFNKEWSKDILGELADVYDGTHQTPTYTKSGVMFLSVENIQTLKSEKYISKEAFEKEFKAYPQSGDILMTRIGDIGTANVVDSNEPIAYYVSLALLKQKKLNPYFLKQSISTHTVVNDLWQRTLHIAFPKKINKNEIEKVEIPFPVSDEQTRIGSYFQNLDKLISLHETKLNKLTNLKNAMLEKMFPNQESDVPEVRFKGFEGAWVESRLGDLMNVTSVKRIHQSDWTNSGVRFLRARDIVASYKNEDVAEYLYITKEKYDEYSAMSGKVKPGDLLVTGVGTIGVPFLIIDETPIYFKDGNIIWFQNETKLDDYFFYYLFIGNGIQSFIKDSAGTGTVGTFTIDSGKKTPIKFPKENEQRKIGAYFKNIDSLIYLHQTELDKLNHLKKACLEKMFV